MRNLRQPVAKILINNMTNLTGSLRIGLYEDYEKNVKVLSFKEEGINIFGGAATGTRAVPATPLANGSLFAGLKASCGCFDPGENEFQLVELNPACPCDPCDYGYAITIEKHVKMPGVGNSENQRFRKSYGGVVPIINCSNVPSLIDDLDLRAMEDDMISQIANDLGMFSGNTDIETASWSPVEARKAFLMEVSDTETFSIFQNGVLIMNITAGVSALVTANTITTAGSNFGIFAFATQDNAGTNDQVMIMSKSNGILFDVPTASLGAGVTILAHYIALLSKSPKVQFAVQYDLGFATTTKHILLTLDNNGNTGTTIVTGTLSGVTTSTAAATDTATVSGYAERRAI